MPFLIDTIVISELRRKNRNQHVVTWFHSISSDDIFLSAITIGEIENGIVRQQRVNPVFANELNTWLEDLLIHYSARILPISTEIARRWGRLCGELGRADADMMIAATALEHNMMVATRNISHFKPTGVALVDPFKA